MDLLELLRKRGMDGDVDLLREALRVLVDGIMDAEVSAQIGAQHGERSPERVTTDRRQLVLPVATTIFAGRYGSTLRILSGVSERGCNSMVQGSRKFLDISVGSG